MAVTVYRSTDSSAPTLSGTVGDLINLLDKCLVTGYGSKSAAGWTKPYTGTNAAVFRQGGGNQFYLDVNDNAPATAKEARVRGYETMSAVSTGTGLFPTVAQVTNGLTIRKSTTADATTRSWILIADDRTFYLGILAADSANVYWLFSFGDFYSTLSGDSYRTLIMGRQLDNSGNDDAVMTMSSSPTGTQTGHYIARNSIGTGTSIAFGKVGEYILGGNSTTFSGTLPYPNPTDGGLYLSPIRIVDTGSSPANAMRGFMRGLYQPLHAISAFTDRDTFSGTGPYAGKTFIVLKAAGFFSSGVYIIETSDWDAN